MKRIRVLIFLSVILFAALLLAGCDDGDNGNSDDGLINLTGQGFFSDQVAISKVAANAPFQVLDIKRAPGRQIVASGTTDGQGFYSVQVNQSKLVAVIIAGAVRVSGLISADPGDYDKAAEVSKDFNAVTDIACEAGITANADGSVDADLYNNERIANLEAGAAVVEATGQVNHLDPASVTAAANLVRQITDDGDHPPQ